MQTQYLLGNEKPEKSGENEEMTMIRSVFSGTSGRTRTATPVKEPDFESGVSTNFTTLALQKNELFSEASE